MSRSATTQSGSQSSATYLLSPAYWQARPRILSRLRLPIPYASKPTMVLLHRQASMIRFSSWPDRREFSDRHVRRALTFQPLMLFDCRDLSPVIVDSISPLEEPCATAAGVMVLFFHAPPPAPDLRRGAPGGRSQRAIRCYQDIASGRRRDRARCVSASANHDPSCSPPKRRGGGF
jgi:hypothetical protein